MDAVEKLHKQSPPNKLKDIKTPTGAMVGKKTFNFNQTKPGGEVKRNTFDDQKTVSAISANTMPISDNSYVPPNAPKRNQEYTNSEGVSDMAKSQPRYLPFNDQKTQGAITGHSNYTYVPPPMAKRLQEGESLSDFVSDVSRGIVK